MSGPDQTGNGPAAGVRPDAAAAALAGDRKALIAGGIGNFIEWYDFIVYGYLATTLATLFFPLADRTTALLATFAAFGVAFFFRPLGGLVFGHFGDKVGRRNTLAAVILLASVATFTIGLLPTYGSIGIVAPILLVLCRCLQGFATGGELSGAGVYVAERAPRNRRGFYASVIGSTAVLGAVGGASVSLLLNAVAADQTITSWAWRLPFLVAGPLGVIGLYLRMRLRDTPAFRELERTSEIQRLPVKSTFKHHYRELLVTFGFTITHAAGFYFLATFMVSYLVETVRIDPTQAVLANLVGLCVAVITAVGMGRLSDVIGRRRITLGACVAYVVLSVPAFLLTGLPGFAPLIVGQCVLGLILGTTSAMVTIVQVELFPARVRYTGAAISYNAGQALCGGTAPFVATLLVGVTGFDLSPAAYLIGLAAVSTVVVGFALRETAPGPVMSEEVVRA